MIKHLFLILILLMTIAPTYAEQVFVDNIDIQEYKGQLGKWIKVISKESLQSLSKKYNTPIDSINEINDIKKKNNIYNKYYFIPYSQQYLSELTAKGISRSIIECDEQTFIWPIQGPERISSVVGYRNGSFHPGLDIPAPKGDAVFASMDGVVLFSGYAGGIGGGYGKVVIIEHRNNFITKYSHNSDNLVKAGDFVKKGQLIAFVGSSGRSTGNHLHFELRCNEIPLDPLDFLPQANNLKIMPALKNWK